jgi:hypothetical protein
VDSIGQNKEKLGGAFFGILICCKKPTKMFHISTMSALKKMKFYDFWRYSKKMKDYRGRRYS